MLVDVQKYLQPIIAKRLKKRITMTRQKKRAMTSWKMY